MWLTYEKFWALDSLKYRYCQIFHKAFQFFKLLVLNRLSRGEDHHFPAKSLGTAHSLRASEDWKLVNKYHKLLTPKDIKFDETRKLMEPSECHEHQKIFYVCKVPFHFITEALLCVCVYSGKGNLSLTVSITWRICLLFAFRVYWKRVGIHSHNYDNLFSLCAVQATGVEKVQTFLTGSLSFPPFLGYETRFHTSFLRWRSKGGCRGIQPFVMLFGASCLVLSLHNSMGPSHPFCYFTVV